MGVVPRGHPGLGSIPGRLPGLGPLQGGPPSLGHDSDPTMAMSSLSSGLTMMTSSGRPTELGLARSWSQEPEQRLSGDPGRTAIKYNDSGVMSGDYSEDRVDHTIDLDTMSDGGFSDVGNYPGIRVPSKESSEPSSLEVVSALRHLNPADVERRRKNMGRNYRYAFDKS